MNKITGIAWFNSSSTVGIVIVETQYDGEKAYIKGVPNVKSLEEDAIEIAQYGAKFPLAEAKSLIKNHGGSYNIEY